MRRDPMHYLRSYRCLFVNPRWQMNCLAGAACQLVPVLGQMVFTGYAFELIETYREEDDSHVPAFDLDRIGQYVARGIWPFVIQLIVLLPLLLFMGLVIFLLGALVRDAHSTSLTARVLLTALGPFGFLVLVLLSVVLVPLTLHVGFRQEISVAAGPFIWDFLSRVGRETALAQLFIGATGLALVLLGSLVFCVPAYPALALAHLAQYHLMAQLYELYRQRGGAPVAVVPLAV